MSVGIWNFMLDFVASAVSIIARSSLGVRSTVINNGTGNDTPVWIDAVDTDYEKLHGSHLLYQT